MRCTIFPFAYHYRLIEEFFFCDQKATEKNNVNLNDLNILAHNKTFKKKKTNFLHTLIGERYFS